jgi:hypothetical protein
MEDNQDPTQQLANLQAQIDDLNKLFHLNNFTTHQDFNKSSSFNYALKVPHYSSAPPAGEVGNIIEVGGKLYICTTASSSAAVWTVVGTQS